MSSSERYLQHVSFLIGLPCHVRKISPEQVKAMLHGNAQEEMEESMESPVLPAQQENIEREAVDMLGGVFNQLAFMVNDAAGPALGWLFCGLILIFGHTLNIAMSCLSAFVHPLRLTFVEYFKNSGYEGKGEAYKPFTVVKK